MFDPRMAAMAGLAGGMALMGACMTATPTETAPCLAPSTRPYVPDIPLPRGFVLVDQSSEDWSSGSLRYIRHRYTGRGDKHAVRVFYREQMVLVRWTPTAERSVHGQCTMSFERGDETCLVTIEGAVSGRVGTVTVDIMITPKASRNSASGR